jgi:alpha-amylase/alpha-mannosidase (GH57 family)
MKPIEVTKAKEKQILTSIYNQTKITTPSRKFIVGNFVRISKAKYIFNKGYTHLIGQQSYLKLLKYNLQIPQHIC